MAEALLHPDPSDLLNGILTGHMLLREQIEAENQTFPLLAVEEVMSFTQVRKLEVKMLSSEGDSKTGARLKYFDNLALTVSQTTKGAEFSQATRNIGLAIKKATDGTKKTFDPTEFRNGANASYSLYDHAKTEREANGRLRSAITPGNNGTFSYH